MDRREITVRSDLVDRMEMAAEIISDRDIEDLFDAAFESFLIGIGNGLAELED